MANVGYVIKSIVFALGHVLIATFGVAVSSAVLFFAIKPALSFFLSAASLSLNSPLRVTLFPIQATFGFVVGYLVTLKQNVFARSKTGAYAWVVPALWFILHFIAWAPPSVLRESRWDHFVGSDLPSAKGVQLVTTLPLITSLTYSLGSYIGRQTAPWRNSLLRSRLPQ